MRLVRFDFWIGRTPVYVNPDVITCVFAKPAVPAGYRDDQTIIRFTDGNEITVIGPTAYVVERLSSEGNPIIRVPTVGGGMVDREADPGV